MRARLSLSLSALCLVALCLVAGAVPALAGPQDVANDVSRQIMSPFCDGLTLHDCPSQAALDLRERIRIWAADGLTKPQIMQRLEREYGPRIHATPRSDGFGVLAWILPAAAVGLGAALAWLSVKRWTGGGGDAAARPGVPEPPTPSERARLDAELAAFRRSP